MDYDFDKVKTIVEDASLKIADDDELAALVDMTLDEFNDYRVKNPKLSLVIEKTRALGRNILREKFWQRALQNGEYKPMRDLAVKHLAFGDKPSINIDVGMGTRDLDLTDDQLKLINRISIEKDGTKIEECTKLLA